MTQASSATRPDLRVQERFLRDVERRALQMAELAGVPRAAALDAVEDTMRVFVARHDARAASDWPVLFWSLLDSALARRDPAPASRGAASGKAADTHGPPAAASDLFAHLPDVQATTALSAALRMLPAHQRQAFLLRVREDFGVAASARVLRLSEAEVRTRLFHALRSLRTALRTQPVSAAGNEAHQDGAWVLRCRALLDAAARDLDGTTLARLERARQAALAPAPLPTPRGGSWLVRVGGLAIAAGLALALSRLLSSPAAPPVPETPPSPPPPPVSLPPPRIAPSEDTPLAAPDFDLLFDAEDEILLDELEFYARLAVEERRTAGQ